MALPTTGSLSFNDIRIELDVPSQSPFGLDEAENGTYATINQCSAQKPSATNPAEVLEWYGYNHTANATVFLTNTEGSATTSTAACNLAAANAWTLYVVGSIYYRDSLCNTLLNQFYRNSAATTWYEFSSGVLLSQGTCAATTTTTTTTANPCICNRAGECGSECPCPNNLCSIPADCNEPCS
jgi:hypothetical protein